MKKLIIAILLLSCQATSNAQTQDSPSKRAQKALSSSVGVLMTYYSRTFTDISGEKWKQEVDWSEKDTAIVYKLAPFNEDKPKDTNWYVRHVIPIMRIDTVHGRFGDSTLFIKMKGYAIRSYKGDFLAAENNFIRIYAPIGWVRNFVRRVETGIMEYQQTFGKRPPERARQIVSAAVLALIKESQFNSSDVKKLLAQNELYITKCQLCEGTKDAFREYLTLPAITEPTDPSWEIGLLSPVVDEQKIVMEKLVTTAVQQYFSSDMNFTKDQVSKMQDMLTKEREISMKIANGKKCATCDGACTKQ